MLLRRVVGLKVIVTEKFKSELTTRMRRAIDRIEANRGQIQFQLDTYVNEIAKSDLNQASQIRGRLNEEKERLLEARAEIESRLREIEGLEIGSEYERGQLEGLIEVNIGDNLFEKLGGDEIVIKDGIVVEVRQKTNPDEAEKLSEEVVESAV